MESVISKINKIEFRLTEMYPITKRLFDCTNLLFDSVILTLSFLHLNGALACVSHEIVKFDPITAYF